MAGNSSIFNSKRIPLAFISSVVLFFIVQAVLVGSRQFWRFCYFYSYPSSGDKLRMEANLRLIAHDQTQRKVFILGSSEAREDIDVDLLNKFLKDAGFGFYNFGLSGYGSPFEMLYVMNKALRYRPDVIVYMPYIGSFFPDTDFELKNIMRSYFHPSQLTFLSKYFGLDFDILPDIVVIELDYVWGRVSPLYQYREQVQMILNAALRNKLGIEKRSEPLRFAYTQNQHPTYFIAQILKEKGGKFQRNTFTQLNQELMIRMISDLRKKGVDFIVLSGPPNPLMQKTFPRELNEEYQSFLAAQSAKDGFVFVPETQLPQFSVREFIDFTHLNAVGRTRFTMFLAENILRWQSQ